VTEAAAVAGAVLACLGIVLLTIADGRRGLALGLALATAGLAAADAAAGKPPLGVTALLVGGLVGALLRLRGGGQAGWGFLPEGSTPRLVAVLVVLIGAGLVAGSELRSPAGAARLAALVVAVLAGGRILAGDRREVALAAASALAVGLGALGGAAALVAGAVAAAGLGVIDGAEPARARG
jgi:hypothetical protein